MHVVAHHDEEEEGGRQRETAGSKIGCRGKGDRGRRAGGWGGEGLGGSLEGG